MMQLQLLPPRMPLLQSRSWSQPQSQSLPPPMPLLPQKRSNKMMMIQQLLLFAPPTPQLDKFPMKISSKILFTTYRMRLCLTVFLKFFNYFLCEKFRYSVHFFLKL